MGAGDGAVSLLGGDIQGGGGLGLKETLLEGAGEV